MAWVVTETDDSFQVHLEYTPTAMEFVVANCHTVDGHGTRSLPSGSPAKKQAFKIGCVHAALEQAGVSAVFASARDPRSKKKTRHVVALGDWNLTYQQIDDAIQSFPGFGETATPASIAELGVSVSCVTVGD